MDIEKLIERLKYYGTTYAIGDNLGKEVDGSDELMLNAATALSTLQAENEKMRAELEQVKRERDAAVDEVERTVERYVPLGPYDRLRELAQADRERRCVVLPCKVGDEIYQPTRNFISTFRVRYIEISACGNLFINTSLEDGIVFNGLGFPESELGKTVFLTRSEAENALKARK